MSDRQTFIDTVISKILLPYIYGGCGIPGIDCSGVAVAGLQAVYPKFTDKTAAGLRGFYRDKEIAPDAIRPGCLLFYAHFSHVVVCVRDWGAGMFGLIGANGGTPLCLTVEDAYHSDAMVTTAKCKIVDGKYSGYWQAAYSGACDPFLGEV